jgi:cell wall assembly regulator SMI1
MKRIDLIRIEECSACHAEETVAKLSSAWERIIRWHHAHLPKYLAENRSADKLLRNGASEEELDAAEEDIGLRFPADVRESYRLHNGSESEYGILPWGFYLLPLDNVVESWRMWHSHVENGAFDGEVSRPEGPIRPVHWNTRWIPISHNSGGDHQCVDLDPAPGGRSGQVIEFNHEVGPVRILATGFGEWLRVYAEQLEAGRYRYDPRDLWVIPIKRK